MAELSKKEKIILHGIGVPVIILSVLGTIVIIVSIIVSIYFEWFDRDTASGEILDTAVNDFLGLCIRVIDGDTVVVEREGLPVKIHLYGVDAPEKDQPYGNVATALTTELTLNKHVAVVGHSTDQYQRIVAFVVVSGGRDLGEELVRIGLAWWYEKYAPNDMEYKALEATARKNRIGLWSQVEPTPPWKFRKK